MKIFIGRQVYNTEFADDIAVRFFPADSKHRVDVLMIMPTSRKYFIHRKSVEVIKNEQITTEKIIPMTENEAFLWMKGNGLVRELHLYFKEAV